jgi:hypothetical protein
VTSYADDGTEIKPAIDPVGGQSGGGGLVLVSGTGTARKLSNTHAAAVGAYVKIDLSTGAGVPFSFVQWASSGAVAVASLRIDASGAGSVYACLDPINAPGTQTLLASGGSVSTNTFAHMDLQVSLLVPPVGSLTHHVKAIIGGTTVFDGDVTYVDLSLDNLNLQSENAHATTTYSDFYAADTILGAVQVIRLGPREDGQFQQFTPYPDGRSHLSRIADRRIKQLDGLPNDTTSGYLHTYLSSKKETFKHQTLVSATAIYGVQLVQALYNVGGPVVGVNKVVISGAETSNEDAGKIGGGYRANGKLYQQVPLATPVDWTAANLASAQFGVGTVAL